MKPLSICFMLVGIIWALGVAWIFLNMSTIAEPVSFTYTSIYYAAMLIGPLLLIAGSILVLNGPPAKVGAILVATGSVVLTLYVGYGISGLFHAEPFQAKPPYLVLGIMVGVTILVDIGAFRLCQLVSSAR